MGAIFILRSNMFKFIKKVFKTIVNTVIGFFKETVNNAEASIILIAASFGITALVSELPFMIALPMWVELTAVAPLISIALVMILIQIIKVRSTYELYI